jgi:hypothetical protein
MAPREDERVDRLNHDLVALRERLGRVETTMDEPEKAAEHRHRELLGLPEIVKHRGEQTEHRSWKLAIAVAVAVASGLGAQLLRGVLGG